MKVLFICGVFASENNSEIIKYSKRGVPYSANIFQEKLIQGFLAQDFDFKVISAPFIAPYPNGYAQWKFSGFKSKQDKYEYVPFCNIWGIRNYSRYKAIRRKIIPFIQADDPEKIIVVYSVHTPFLRAAVEAKLKDPRIKICLIVLDLPQYMNLEEHQSFIYRWGKKYDIQQFEKLNPYVDSYVLLTEHMREKLDIHSRPYIVVEGIVQAHELKISRSLKKENGIQNIFYGGILNRRFGVKTLVDAFLSTDNENLRLVVCGNGELHDYLMLVSSKDKRVIYKGQVTPAEVRKLIASADLLVNPRPNNEIYTRYSFPSKNIEYLLSGRPVLGYMLDGMPPYYDKYMSIIDSESQNDVENMRKAIEKTLAMEKYDNSLFIEYASKYLLANRVVSKIIEISREKC